MRNEFPRRLNWHSNKFLHLQLGQYLAHPVEFISNLFRKLHLLNGHFMMQKRKKRQIQIDICLRRTVTEAIGAYSERNCWPQMMTTTWTGWEEGEVVEAIKKIIFSTKRLLLIDPICITDHKRGRMLSFT